MVFTVCHTSPLELTTCTAPGQDCYNLVQHQPPEKLTFKKFINIAQHKMVIQQSTQTSPVCT